MDEWLHVDIQFPVEFNMDAEKFAAFIQTITGELARQGHHLLPASHQEQIPPRGVTKQTRYDLNGRLILQTPVSHLGAYVPTQIDIYASGREDEEVIEITINGRKTKHPDAKSALKNLVEQIGLLPTGPHPVRPIDPVKQDPKWEVFGYAGYEEAWEHSPFLCTDTGKILHRDDLGKWWECNSLKEGIAALATDYFPVIPHGSTPLHTIIRSECDKLALRIKFAAETNDQAFLQSLGHKGKIFTANDGAVYIIP